MLVRSDIDSDVIESVFDGTMTTSQNTKFSLWLFPKYYDVALTDNQEVTIFYILFIM